MNVIMINTMPLQKRTVYQFRFCLLKGAFYFGHVFEKNHFINGFGYRTCFESTASL